MTYTPYGSPLLISESGQTTALERISLSQSVGTYNEEFVQNLVFKHPESIPINQIDSTYTELVPICCELSTSAGYPDILFATKEGRLCIVEAKLWRNPEARRKVVGQILDYAQELAGWGYEDLQRQISRTTGQKGNVLFNLVKARFPEIEEAEYIDAVSRALRRGEFLLLILGDGIREGVSAIAEYIDNSGNLDFTFGLVEVAIYRHGNGDLLFQPRILAKTEVHKRTIVSLSNDRLVLDDADSESDSGESTGHRPSEHTERQQIFTDFWSGFVPRLTLDDPVQSLGKISKAENYFLYLPPGGEVCWVSAFLARSTSRVGVYLTFIRGAFGDHAYASLYEDREAIEAEIGIPIQWESNKGKYRIVIRKPIDDPWDEQYRDEIYDFFADALNRFVNVFRPRLEKIASEQ